MDSYFTDGEDPNYALALLRKNSCFHGVDKQGRPIYIERFCREDIVNLFETLDHDLLIRFFVANCELSKRLLYPVCSLVKGSRVETTQIIMDLSGMEAKFFNNTTKNFI